MGGRAGDRMREAVLDACDAVVGSCWERSVTQSAGGNNGWDRRREQRYVRGMVPLGTMEIAEAGGD